MKIHGDGELFSAFLDGELSAEESDAVRAHVSFCQICRDELASLRQAKTTLGRAPRRAIPADLVASLERRLTRPLWKTVLERLLPPVRILVPAGAFAAVGLCALAWLGMREPAADQSIPLEPLLAAHSRYTAEALVPANELIASNYSAQLNAYYGDNSDQD
jgi:anti-sigma factor RsiW